MSGTKQSHKMSKHYYVYIATNKTHRVLYTGMTNNLKRRMLEHKNKLVSGFSSKYNVSKLVWYAAFGKPLEAIMAEKKIKAGSRLNKIKLIESMNPGWNDLYEEM